MGSVHGGSGAVIARVRYMINIPEVSCVHGCQLENLVLMDLIRFEIGTRPLPDYKTDLSPELPDLVDDSPDESKAESRTVPVTEDEADITDDCIDDEEIGYPSDLDEGFSFEELSPLPLVNVSETIIEYDLADPFEHKFCISDLDHCTWPTLRAPPLGISPLTVRYATYPSLVMSTTVFDSDSVAIRPIIPVVSRCAYSIGLFAHVFLPPDEVSLAPPDVIILVPPDVVPLVSHTSLSFASAVVGTFARNAVLAFYFTEEEIYSFAETIAGWIDLMCSKKCRELIANSNQLFVRTVVTVYLEKMMGFNTYDQMEKGLEEQFVVLSQEILG
ncbi:hypothetical protein KSP39_PZI001178 [Platanthera zijinensis]|uniref:Uncharacterized protein n=1 Tax=Platanthera zijinensis TaxID=2320716 RepID=A0AAP0C214_9ASPA